MNKRVLLSAAALATGIFLFSNLALASTTSYNFRLPTMGTRTTSYVTKQTSDPTTFNRVSYFGWAGSEVNCWVEDSSGGQISSTSVYTGTGNVRMYIYSNIDYKMTQVRMGTKTAISTWHDCDVQGVFDPQ